MLSLLKVNKSNLKQLVVLGCSLPLAGCSVLGIGYNNFLCQEQDAKNKCVSASAFLEQDQQAQAHSLNSASNSESDQTELVTSANSNSSDDSSPVTPVAVYETSGNWVDDTKPKIHYYQPSLLHQTNTDSNQVNTNLIEPSPMPDIALAVNGTNQPLDKNNFLVTGYYAFPYLQYPQVADNHYLVIWVAPIKLQGKIHPPRFFTIPYIH